MPIQQPIETNLSLIMPENPPQTDSLILLVGSNPLPNYVAAKMLLSGGGKVGFVHSKDTKAIAEKLAEGLGLCSNQIGFFQINNLSCSSEIQGAVEHAFGWFENSNTPLHLHYTGGTKQMAVHAYQALKDSGKDFVASYLDARELKLRIDGEDIGYEIEEELQLKDLMALHAMTLKEGRTKNLLLKDKVFVDLMDFYAQDNNAESKEHYHKWLAKTINSRDFEQPAVCQNVKRNKKELEYKPGEELKGLVLVDSDSLKYIPFSKCIEVLSNPTLVQLLREPVPTELDFGEVCKKLDGEWLEEYAYWCVEKVSSCVGLHEWHLSVKSQEGEKNKNDKFELDVVAIRKHQVFVISCTTASDKPTCKSKLFEVHLRARQIGGDEARTILLCLSERPDVLQKELDGPMEKHIKVFGRQDLKELPKKLCEWMKEQSAQEKTCNWNPETQTCN